MFRHLILTILFLTACLIWGYSQTAPLDEAAIKKIKRELNDAGTDREKARLLLRLSNLYIVSEQDLPTAKDAVRYADQAIAISKVIKDEVLLAEGCLLRSHLAQIQHDYPRGKGLAVEAIRLFQRQQNFNQEGEARVLFWSNSVLSGLPYEERIPLLTKAAACFHAGGNKCREADCLREIGDVYHILGEFGKALNELKKSMELAKPLDCPHLEGTYDLLDICYVMLGDYSAAIENGLMAIKTAEESGKGGSLSMCTYYCRLGLAYIRANDLISGKKCLERSIDIAIKCKDANSIGFLTLTRANLLLEEHKPLKALALLQSMIYQYPEIRKGREMEIANFMIHIYQQLEQYERAKPFAASVEQFLASDPSDPILVAYSYNHLIPYYIAAGDLKKAAFYTNAFSAFCKKANLPIFNSNYEMIRFRLDSARGNYLSAIRHLQQYNVINDSLANETKSMQINQLGILFETEKKDRNIQALTNTSKLQQSHLRQATLRQNIYFGGALLLLVILSLLFYSFRIKQKTNRKLREQQQVIHSKNDSLQHLLTEKEWLVKEIHHRVKNNLHMVAGLLASQAEFLQGEEALSAITDSQHRVQAMSLIHQKLYQSEDLSYTEMSSYIFDLTEYIRDAFGRNVIIQLEIEKVSFSLSYSVPIGLILNEAVTNALKYAFPDGRKGIIKILLKSVSVSEYILTVTDDGVGLPEDFNPANAMSLGINLMMGLSADINGTFHVDGGHGTEICVSFYYINHEQQP